MFKNIIFGKKESKKIPKENIDYTSFEACSKRYAELVRSRDFSMENLDEIRSLQSKMLNLCVKDL